MTRFVNLAVFAAIVAAAAVTAVSGQSGASGAIVAVDEVVSGIQQKASGHSGATVGAGVSPKSGSSKAQTRTSGSKSKPTASPKVTATGAGPYRGSVLGDKYTFLNFEVVDRVQPVHTIAAKKAGAKGLVQVEILVESDGRVIGARARTGNQLLWPEAERAALASRLNRPIDNGRPARALGFLVYRFGPADDDD